LRKAIFPIAALRDLEPNVEINLETSELRERVCERLLFGFRPERRELFELARRNDDDSGLLSPKYLLWLMAGGLEELGQVSACFTDCPRPRSGRLFGLGYHMYKIRHDLYIFNGQRRTKKREAEASRFGAA